MITINIGVPQGSILGPIYVCWGTYSIIFIKFTMYNEKIRLGSRSILKGYNYLPLPPLLSLVQSLLLDGVAGVFHSSLLDVAVFQASPPSPEFSLFEPPPESFCLVFDWFQLLEFEEDALVSQESLSAGLLYLLWCFGLEINGKINQPIQ